MQCNHKHKICYIDKKAIHEDRLFFIRTKILNVPAITALGNGSWKAGIEKLCTGKEWVYYDKTPKDRNNKLHRKLYELGYFKTDEVGCGKCEICRVEKSKEWATKGYCENQMWKNKIFITLTYNNENLPWDRKLKRSDIQKFWKDLRYHTYKNTKKAQKIDLSEERDNLEEIYHPSWEEFQKPRRKNDYPIRYLNCGEYGPKTKRPHYHAIVWNFKPTDLRRHSKDRRGYWLFTSNKLNKIWEKGFVIIGDVNAQTCAYVARYCTKKYSKSEEEQKRMKEKKQLEFIGASSLGFIGYYYWEKYKENIKKAAGIIMKSKNHTFLAKLPKAMQKKWKEENEDEYEDYDFWKNKTGEENWKYILSKTNLTESEYIEETVRKTKRKYERLTRNYGDLKG